MNRALAAALTSVAAAGAARAAYAVLTRRPPGGDKTWTRVNHRGEPVTLLEGPAVAAGAVLVQILRGVPGGRPPGLAQSSERARSSARPAQALALAGAGAFGFGVYDDLAGSGKRRGLRGHLGALANGEVTTGAVKLGGLGVTGLASALLLGGDPADVVVNTGLVAGGANLLNLFDLRPGRAIKVATLSAALIKAGAPERGGQAVAAPLGAALALLPDDLGERAMLGDAGANALGAMLGGAAAVSLPRPARIALLAAIVALTGASEKVSFTKVIEAHAAAALAGYARQARAGRRGRRPRSAGSGTTRSRRRTFGRRLRSIPAPGAVTAPVTERGGARQHSGGIGRAAVMIGVITVLARLVGFGRQVVFAHTVGTTCLGTAYTTANMVPNIIYDIVLGGALASVVVPVLAGPAGRAGDAARQISSALLTWTVVLLVPVSAVVAVAAHPIVSVLLGNGGGCPRAELAGVGTRMLIVFAPQVLFYGLAVVLYGILQSHRRFGAPALAPLLSSLVVVGAYAGFGVIGGAYVNRLRDLPPSAEYLLSGGTTLGVLALVLTAVVPAWRLRIGLRPALPVPRRGRRPGTQAGDRRGADARRAGRLGRRGDRAGQPVRRPGRAGAVRVRVGGVRRALRGARGADRDEHLPRAVGRLGRLPGRWRRLGRGLGRGLGPLRRDRGGVDARRHAGVLARRGRAGRRAAAAGARLRVALRRVGVGPRGDAGRLRARARRVRAVGQPLPRPVRAGQEQGAGRGDERRLGCW